VTKQNWESLGKELNTIKKQKLELESQLSTLETNNAVLRDVDHDISVRLGKLKYQNEANKAQKAAMGRSLSEKEIKIKTQQLEIDELKGHIKTTENALSAKDHELENLRQKMKESERTIDRVTRERDEASRAWTNSVDHLNRARNLADTLAQREKLITDLRHQIVAEQLKVAGLEDDLEAAQEKSNQADIDDVKSKLMEKTSTCDRQRNQLKMIEAQLSQSQSRLMKITNHGESLCGAAHVVKPSGTSKLPKLVISCVECYNKNLPCDNGARCRNCVENNTQCARWRCSLKHKYGECPLTPCPLSHDSQGWLVLRTERPEW
jgi:chromosome segregation ATPase